MSLRPQFPRPRFPRKSERPPWFPDRRFGMARLLAVAELVMFLGWAEKRSRMASEIQSCTGMSLCLTYVEIVVQIMI